MSNDNTAVTYDLAVIGAGSGGMAAARRAAEAGQRVIIFEASAVGGTCVNRGCVPKKLLVHAARGADTLQELPSLGWDIGEGRFDWSSLQRTVHAKVEELSGFHAKRMNKLGIDFVGERAALAGSGTVMSDTCRAAADRILIATGARPIIPPMLGAEYCLTSDDLFLLQTLPKTMAIVGGGYIAVEFACMMRRFGVKITLFERGDRLIAPFDPEVAELLRCSMSDQGIDIRLGAAIDAISPVGRSHVLTGTGTDPDERFDAVLMAVGRRPNTQGLNLDTHGIKMDSKGAILVDDTGMTSVAGVYAIGDVTPTLALTPVAVREGRRVIDIIRSVDEPLPRPTHVPTAAFTTPECAAVGMSEADAQQTGLDYEVRRTTFKPLASLLGGDENQVFMKALVERSSGCMLGFHFFGPHASEASQMGAIALAAGLSEQELHHTMALHPTTAEEVLSLGRRDEPLHQKAD